MNEFPWAVVTWVIVFVHVLVQGSFTTNGSVSRSARRCQKNIYRDSR